MLMLKIMASLILGLLGGYYFWKGIKTANNKMLLGGVVLTILSYLVFSGGSDQDTKAIMNNLMQTTPGQQQVP